jgi:hypothetical protein
MRTPRRTSRSRLRRVLTVPNVLATIAVLVAMVGSTLAVAYASTSKISGSNVRAGTVAGVKFRNGVVTRTKFTTLAVLQLRVKGARGDAGAQGEVGDPGATGELGLDGNKGATGDKGKPAPRAYTFQTVTQSGRVQGPETNPSTSIHVNECSDPLAPPIGCPESPLRYPRWNYKCSHWGDTDPVTNGLVNRHCRTSTTSAPRLERSNQPIIVTSANPSGGLLDMPFPGTIVLNASATFYTQRTNETDARSSAQQRLECQLQVVQVVNGMPQDPVDVGVPVTVYRYMNSDPTARNEYERLVTISATGAIDRPAGVYESQLACRAPDDTTDPNERLEFIEGNMSVLSTRSNGNA